MPCIFIEMLKLHLIFVLIDWCLCSNENLLLITKKRSSFLENYKGYASLAILQLEVPPEINFVSFKISAESFDLSIFGCTPEEVDIYAKRGSIPFLNPDNSKIPKWVKNVTNSEVYSLKILTDNTHSYINITSPEAGLYYFAAFFPYISPENIVLKQKGLSTQCTGYINILVYVSKTPHILLITENQNYHIHPPSYNQICVESNVKNVILSINNTIDSSITTNVTVRLNYNSLPSKNKYVEMKTIKVSNNVTEISYWLNKPGKYYLEYEVDKKEHNVSLQISLKTLNLDEMLENDESSETLRNELDDIYYKSAVIDLYQDKVSRETEPYLFYNLIKELGSEAFLYTFNINQEEENDFMIPVALNLTSEGFTVLKFELQDVVDVGGSLEFSIDVGVHVNEYNKLILTPESADQIVIGCISQDVYEIPVLPRHCLKNGVKTLAPIVANNTMNNSTIVIPYPEAGVWYATLKLFCEPCRDCECYRNCSEVLRTCIAECSRCDSRSACGECLNLCKMYVAEDSNCKNCNCDDHCKPSEGYCNSTIMFDLSSFPCVMGKCGPNGRCQFLIADGYIFSACYCRNNYIGIDCTDDTYAIPFWKLALGQILLITSNLIMIIPVYLAWKREYYPEAIIYASVIIFSSVYHACDVADYSIRFCLTSHHSLQFADFFTAQFAIWCTMIAIADVELKYRTILETGAAILLAYFTEIDKKAVWIFLSITIPGVAIIGVSWFFKYKKYGKNFIKRRYLSIYFSCGIVVMGVGILVYAFLQTNGNYMYLHSIWHCIVGIAVILVLPKKDTFPSLPDL